MKRVNSLRLIAAGVVWFVGCDNRQQPMEPIAAAPRASVGDLTVTGLDDGTLSMMSLTLPFSGSTSTSGSIPAFEITQTGNGRAGVFQITNSANGRTALVGLTNGLAPAGVFELTNSESNSPALSVQSNGRGGAVYAVSTYAGNVVRGTTSAYGSAGYFDINNQNSTYIALRGITNGGGAAVQGYTSGTGNAGYFQINTGDNANAALRASTGGSGVALQAEVGVTSSDIAVFQASYVNQARIDRDGTGFFNGGTQTGGADVAEAFEVEGGVRDYRPGDVLVISTRSDRRVEHSAERYSTRVIGVYATKPGVLLTERGIDDSLDDMVPVGVVGVIPTRASVENGVIRRGDLLVTASVRGHAMRADPDRLRFGMVLGKALEEFPGPGTGVIKVLVNVK